MTRFHTVMAIVPLLLLLLLLPLQGHARLAADAVSMPCTMEHQPLHGVELVPGEPMEHPCDSGAPCGLQCLDCANCAHAVSGMALSCRPSQATPDSPVYTPQPAVAFSSTALPQDHPPPRNG